MNSPFSLRRRNFYPWLFLVLAVAAIAVAHAFGTRLSHEVLLSVIGAVAALVHFLYSQHNHNTERFGARQATCRLIHAASGCKLRSSKCVLMMESRSGLSVTTSTGFQLRVCRDQRAGLSAWAWVYSAWRAARMA